MGKADTPATPDYKGQALATANAGKYSEISPYGAVTWDQRPGSDPLNPQPGDSIRTTTLSPQQQALYNQLLGNQLKLGTVGSSMLNDLTGGRQQAQDALYRRATQYYDDRFGEGEAALRGRLENSGLAAGSTGYDRAMRDFGRTRDAAYADATDRAILGADNSQNSAVSRVVQLLAASRGQAPNSSNNTAQGPDLLGATTSGYNAALGSANAQNAQSTQTVSTAATLAALGYLAFSDRRLKSNITAVGTGYGGLTIYEYDIAGRHERGYMSNEVRRVRPAAVIRFPDGYDRVAYWMLGGRP